MGVEVVLVDVGLCHPLGISRAGAITGFGAGEALLAKPRRVEAAAPLVDDYVVAQAAGTVLLAVDWKRRLELAHAAPVLKSGTGNGSKRRGEAALAARFPAGVSRGPEYDDAMQLCRPSTAWNTV